MKRTEAHGFKENIGTPVSISVSHPCSLFPLPSLPLPSPFSPLSLSYSLLSEAASSAYTHHDTAKLAWNETVNRDKSFPPYKLIVSDYFVRDRQLTTQMLRYFLFHSVDLCTGRARTHLGETIAL